ncbi:MAG TPA: hypothetical protein VM513_09660 [Kofleriaceae bacterium]|nr:hypothetical protein [Kofleriaceae bacterium]
MRLRVPAALVFTLTASCGDDGAPQPPVDAPAFIDGVVCVQYCITDTGSRVCNGQTVCVDSNNECPSGCMPEPVA